MVQYIEQYRRDIIATYGILTINERTTNNQIKSNIYFLLSLITLLSLLPQILYKTTNSILYSTL